MARFSYDNQQHVYDNHTLYVCCGCASTEQIHETFARALHEYARKTEAPLDCRFRVNRVETGDGMCIAYVFVTNSEVYHMLIGNNPDGSDRITYIDDPSWVPPGPGALANADGWTTCNFDSKDKTLGR